MAAGPAGTTTASSRGHLRAAHADREQVVDTLKAAFVQGRLAKDEFDLRIGQAFASRTYADLAAVTADIPPGPPAITADIPPGPPAITADIPPVPPPLPPVRVLTWAEKAAAWGLYGIVMTVILTVVVLPAQTTIGAAALTAAVIYSVFWLLGGLIVIAARHGGPRHCVDRRIPGQATDPAAEPGFRQPGGRP